MQYKSLAETPDGLKSLDGINLSLEQINSLVTEALELLKYKSLEAPWDIAKAIFKLKHTIIGSSWESRKDELSSLVSVQKQADGTYDITSVSTAAIVDLDGDEFTIPCIDWDRQQAELAGDYPEFRIFHKKGLGFGRVNKMQRVGIFAVDSGKSYNDPFSLGFCEVLANDRTGKWRSSRGFHVHEMQGNCESCSTELVIDKSLAVSGFRCPHCYVKHRGYSADSRGLGLSHVKYLKARTFDVTATDVPAVPMTSFSATKKNNDEEQSVMTKKELAEKLKEAGMKADDIKSRLDGIDPEVLKEMDANTGFAVLKAATDPKAVAEAELDEVVELDVEGLTTTIVDKVTAEVAKMLKEHATVTLDISELTDYFDGKLEAIGEEVTALKEAMSGRKAKVAKEAGDEDEESPRKAHSGLIWRMKGQDMKKKKPAPPTDEDDEDDDEYDEDDEEESVTKQRRGIIADGRGQQFESMTSFIRNTNGGNRH